jgi:hypothetical protein
MRALPALPLCRFAALPLCRFAALPLCRFTCKRVNDLRRCRDGQSCRMSTSANKPALAPFGPTAIAPQVLLQMRPALKEHVRARPTTANPNRPFSRRRPQTPQQSELLFLELQPCDACAKGGQKPLIHVCCNKNSKPLRAHRDASAWHSFLAPSPPRAYHSSIISFRRYTPFINGQYRSENNRSYNIPCRRLDQPTQSSCSRRACRSHAACFRRSRATSLCRCHQPGRPFRPLSGRSAGIARQRVPPQLIG